MADLLQIDFVSDVTCPWCAIGLSSLKQALARLGGTVEVQIAVHPFELNPTMGREGEDIVEYLGKKYGRTPEQIAETQAMIRDRGAAVGFTFGSRNRVYNTFDAHRLLYWAGIEGKQVPLKLALMQAYHTEGKNPSNHDVLIDVAHSVGLDAAQAREVLESERFANEVRAEEHEYQAMGIQSVPAVIFNRRYLVSGGQPVEVFEQAIRQIVSEAN